MSKMTSVPCALVGLGRAGQARLKALEQLVDADLIHISSRRNPHGPSFETVLASNAQLVVLCRESGLHPQDIKRVLEAGKHVLVEYPPAFDTNETRLLFTMARGRNLVLHVGLFGLLSEWMGQVRKIAADPNLHALSYEFTGGFGRVVKPAIEARLWGTVIWARLHHLWHWLGSLSLERCYVVSEDRAVTIDVALRNEAGVHIRLVEEHRQAASRSRNLTLTDQKGGGISVPDWRPGQNGFLRDTQACLKRVLSDDEVGRYIEANDILAVQDLADQINSAAVAVRLGPM